MAPEPATPPAPDKPRTRMSRTGRFRIAAGSLAVAGASLLVTGIAYELKRSDADDRLAGLDITDPSMTPAIRSAQDDYDQAGNLRWLGLGGGALMSASVPLFRVDVSHGVPWWSYVVGAAGAGFAAWGGFELYRDNECQLQLTTGGCARARDSAGRGGLLFAAAAPLLTFPLAHLVEWRVTERQSAARKSVAAQAYLAPGPSSLTLVVRKDL